MKTPCAVQCPQCPFRSDSVPGYLGQYTVQTVAQALWRNIPFYCHPTVDYTKPNWQAKAARNGKLCRGSLVFANRMMAPVRPEAYADEGGGDLDVIAARKAVGTDPKVDSMVPRAFMDWHSAGPTTPQLDALKERRAAAVKAGYRKGTEPLLIGIA